MISLEERSKKIRWSVFWSLVEKVFVVLVAIAAFEALALLGDACDEAAKSKKTRYKLDADTLNELSLIAGQIAATPAAHDALANAAKNFRPKPAPPRRGVDAFGTAAELATAVERLVDIEIWKEYTDTVKKIADAPPLKRDELRPDPLTNAEARARGLTMATHALVESAVLKLPSKSPATLRMYDEDDPMHVMFEILWYSALIVGVLASSYLLLIIFRALPFTSIEGYWTERVKDLVSRAAPSAAIRTVAGTAALAPLAAAVVLGGGVIGGTSYATMPGGASRTTIIHEHEPLTVTHTSYSPELTFDFRSYPQTPPAFDEQGLKKKIDEARDAVNAATKNAVDQRLMNTEARIDRVDSTMDRAIDQQLLIGDLALDAREAGRYSASKIDVVSKKVGKIDDVDSTTTTIKSEQAKGAVIDNDVLGQSAAADERGYFSRAFGWTLFQVTPGVIDAMRAKLGAGAMREGTPERAFIDALGKMKKGPFNFRDFDKELDKVLPDSAVAIAKENRRALLRLSALPRE